MKNANVTYRWNWRGVYQTAGLWQVLAASLGRNRTRSIASSHSATIRRRTAASSVVSDPCKRSRSIVRQLEISKAAGCPPDLNRLRSKGYSPRHRPVTVEHRTPQSRFGIAADSKVRGLQGITCTSATTGIFLQNASINQVLYIAKRGVVRTLGELGPLHCR